MDNLRIGVFFDEYMPYHETKDPGQLVAGFTVAGHDCEMITLDKPELKGYSGQINIIRITKYQMFSEEFWRKAPYDAIICYTWLRAKYLPLLRVIAKSGKKILIKSDTDGRCCHPVYPWWDMYIYPGLNLINLRIFYRRFKFLINQKKHLRDLIDHFSLVDEVIVESPQAFLNLAYILGENRLLEKIYVIQNPVLLDVNPELIEKKKVLTVVGDLDRKLAGRFWKNTPVMVSAICDFLKVRTDYTAKIVGNGEETVKNLMKGCAKSVSNRVSIMGNVKNKEVKEILTETQIFFMPSIAEGFSVAASEALCHGCSIVGTPLECLMYLSQGATYGTIASDFKKESLVASLLLDSLKWDRGEYKSKKIAIWSRMLSRKTIIGKYIESLNRCLKMKN
jgi:Glycosyl transferases group 1